MTEMVIIIVVMFLFFSGISSLANRIPKTGRCFDARGEEITATITNNNRAAEKAVTMRAKDANGRSYRVKLKASEAKLWIKGDSIRIILSEKSGNYRVLFHEYFRENEERIREHALKKLKKSVSPNFIAAHIVGYTKDSPEAFRASEADSQTVFTFATYMRMIDVYSVVSGLMAVGFLLWYTAVKPSFFQYLIPLGMVLLMLFLLNGTITICKRVMTKVNQ